MPHVTFIHGITNKPAKAELLKNWEDALIQGGLDLGAEGVGTSMVYWADVMYPEPTPTVSAFESVDEGLGTTELDEQTAWIGDLPARERAFVDSMSNLLGFDGESPGDDEFVSPEPSEDVAALDFEAIPLPWCIKRRVMKAWLRDVHHYLFNSSQTPRPGETYRVRDHIRELFISQLAADSAANDGGRHVVVSHSMGTVISCDCLKNVPACVGIDGYMTVGSPLGISEVHDNFDPKYHKNDAFPSAKLSGEWVNVYDRLDPVAIDARLANDYRKGGEKVITDQRVRNDGRWRHSSWKYFGQDALCNHLRDLLDL